MYTCVCACEKIKPDTNRWSTVRLCFQGCDAMREFPKIGDPHITPKTVGSS